MKPTDPPKQPDPRAASARQASSHPDPPDSLARHLPTAQPDPSDASARPAHGHHDPEELHNEGVAHEHSDVNVRAILTFAAIVTAVTIVCAVIVWGLLRTFEGMAAARDPRASPVVVPAGPLPGPTTASPYFGNAPGPRLMVNEPAALGAMRQTEQQQLHGYGWKDEKAGVAHLPIDQAKKLIAERGLPARAQSADPMLGTHAPAFGEATGGRSITTQRAAIGKAVPTAPPEGQVPDATKNPVGAPTSHKGGGA